MKEWSRSLFATYDRLESTGVQRSVLGTAELRPSSGPSLVEKVDS